jgi:hypothetical protein
MEEGRRKGKKSGKRERGRDRPHGGLSLVLYEEIIVKGILCDGSIYIYFFVVL